MKTKTESQHSPIPLDDCGMALLAQTLGDKWMLLIIRQVFYKVTRFEDIRRELNIPRAVLSSRLKTLVDMGILRKEQYQSEGQRKRFSYTLNAAGFDLLPLLMEAMHWGDKHLRNQDSNLIMLNADNQQEVRRAFVDELGEVVTMDKIRFRVKTPEE